MLTEYSSYDDIRKFRDKAFEKLDTMMEGWLGKKIDRLLIEWKRTPPSLLSTSIITLTIEKQKLLFRISPIVNSRGIAKQNFCYTLHTHVETSNGKMTYFIDRNEISVGTPHYFKRRTERFKGDSIPMIDYAEYVQYIRNGRTYELEVLDESVSITRKIESDIRMYITYLSRNMCTGNNYQALLDRVGERIDEDDIYVWK